jgi:hypothetical protein
MSPVDNKFVGYICKNINLELRVTMGTWCSVIHISVHVCVQIACFQIQNYVIQKRTN